MRLLCAARSAVKAAQIATGITLGLGGFWIAYSKLAIEHNLPLPPAIDAAQDALPTRAAAKWPIILTAARPGARWSWYIASTPRPAPSR